MAAFSTTRFKLFKFPASFRFSLPIVLNTPLVRIRILNFNLPFQNFRQFSKNEESAPKNPFGTPEFARKKTVPIQKITLLSPEGKIIEQVTMEKAQNIAKNKNLQLVQVIDLSFKSTIATYQLMSQSQLIEEEIRAKSRKNLDKRSAAKQTKLIIISAKIDEHDLQVKVNKLERLLKKNHKVEIFISNEGNDAAVDAVAKSIGKGLSDNGKLQKRVSKKTGIKLYFEPNLPNHTQEDDPS